MSTETLSDINRSIEAMKIQKDEAVENYSQCNVELSKIKASLARGILPQNEYRTLNEKRAKLIEQKEYFSNQIQTLKRRIDSRSQVQNDIRSGLIDDISEKSGKSRIIELKDKYVEFSKDMSRVSSMRVMASRFVEDLESILKEI